MATDKYASEMESLRSDMKALQADLVSLTKAFTGDVRNGAQKIAEGIDEARVAGMAKAQDATARASESMSATVRENPVASVAAAAGLGFVVGALLRRS